ncbi:MAG: fluoride efflux transporter CrcB [Pyrinomonadaceae bacterium]
METLTKYLAVAVGSACGGCLRYYMGGSVLARTAAPFPTATFVINITGSFIIGFFLTLATERINISPHLRLAVAVGFVGAYTTFSTFEYETARLVEEKGYVLAALNVILSVLIGFIAVWSGIIAARLLEKRAVTDSTAYASFEQQANADDPAQSFGAERDIRDATITLHNNEEIKRPAKHRPDA